jgi:hypothetical protein
LIAGNSIKGRLFQVINSSWAKWKFEKYHCYKKLSERDDDLEVGIFFLEGTLQGGSLNQRMEPWWIL